MEKNFTDIIKSRKSTREGFLDKEIPEEILIEIIECGLSAPSSKNAQPWKLHVVTNRSLLDAVAKAIKTAPNKQDFIPHDPTTGLPRKNYVSTVTESAHIIEDTPVSIFIENQGKFSNNRQAVVDSTDDVRYSAVVGMGLEYLGLGTCVENMWLAAGALGIGAAFNGDSLIAEKEIKGMLSMEGDLVGVVSLGYAQSQCLPRTEFDLSNVEFHQQSE